LPFSVSFILYSIEGKKSLPTWKELFISPSPVEFLVSPKVAVYYPISNFVLETDVLDGGPRSPLYDLLLPTYRHKEVYNYENYVLTKLLNIRFFKEPAICIFKINFNPNRQTSDAWGKLYNEFYKHIPYQTWEAIKWRILETIQEEGKGPNFAGDIYYELIDDVSNIFCIPTVPSKVSIREKYGNLYVIRGTEKNSFEFTRAQRDSILSIFEYLCKTSSSTLEEITYFTEVRDIRVEYKRNERIPMLGFIWKILIGSDFIVYYSDGLFYDLLWPNRAEEDLNITYPENYRSPQRMIPFRRRSYPMNTVNTAYEN
jgi:hypothetical protein